MVEVKPKKSGSYSRNKGKRGESEARNLIQELTGIRLKRNTSQTESGGYDLIVDLMECETQEEKLKAVELDRYAFEIKNTSDGFTPAYWKQAVEQGIKYKRHPVLMWKKPLKGWYITCYASTVIEGKQYGFELTDIITTTPETFFKMVKLFKGK